MAALRSAGAETQTIQGWLESIGLGDKYDAIEGYLTTDPDGHKSSWHKDLRGMLEAEQEDEDEEDLKDMIGEMELDEEAATTFREAIGKLKAVLV